MQRKVRGARWPSFVWQILAEHLDVKEMSICESVSHDWGSQLRSVCLRDLTHTSLCDTNPRALPRFIRRHSCRKVETLTLAYRFLRSVEFVLVSVTRLTLHVTYATQRLDLRACHALQYLELASTDHTRTHSDERFLYPTSSTDLARLTIHNLFLGQEFLRFLSRSSGLRHLDVTFGLIFQRAEAADTLRGLVNLASLNLAGCNLQPANVQAIQHLVLLGTLESLRVTCCLLFHGPMFPELDASMLRGDNRDAKCHIEVRRGLEPRELTLGRELWIRDDNYDRHWIMGRIRHRSVPSEHSVRQISYDDCSEGWNKPVPETASRFLPLHPNDRSRVVGGIRGRCGPPLLISIA